LGNEAIWRENEDGAKKAILIVDPTQQVTGDGFVVSWNVYTTRGRRSQTVHLQIWRPVNAANHRCCSNAGIPVSPASFQYRKDNSSYYISREAYIGHGRLCLSVPRRIPALLHGPGCNLGKWHGVPSSCALLGGFCNRCNWVSLL